MSKRANNTETPTLFELETVGAELVAAPIELETEVPADSSETAEPTARELERIARQDELDAITSGYSHDEWIDVMLTLDPALIGLSDGLGADRLFMARHAAKRSRTEASKQARAERRAKLDATAEALTKARTGATYRAMSALLPELKSRRVVLTLTGKTVTVDSVNWEKGNGWVSETVATFTVVKGVYVFRFPGTKRVERGNLEQAVQYIADLTTEREKDLMPLRFRHAMRTHRAKNSTPSDITGNRAARNVSLAESGGDELSAADIEKYPALAMVQGPKLTTSGRKSMQGVALTADERRTRDRERLIVWRAAKRAEKLAKQA